MLRLADARHAAIERFLFGLEQRDRNADIGKIHRNATTHGAGAHDGDRRNLALRRLVGEARNL